MSENTLKLYSFPLSGNAHRVELALSLMGLPYELVEVNLREGEQRSDWFKKLNPTGKVPVLIDGETVVTESTAILTYLAAKFDDGTWMPEDPGLEADVHKWFARAITLLAAGPAAARLITLFGAGFNPEETIQKGHDFLALLEAELAGLNFLVGNRPTLADIAIYTYVAHAPEGHVSLNAYENIRRWLAVIEALPGFVGMQKTDVSAAA